VPAGAVTINIIFVPAPADLAANKIVVSDVYTNMGRLAETGVLAADVFQDQPAERLAALFGAHSERLYRLARRLTPTADEARDLVQDTFLRAASTLGSVPVGTPAEEAWLVRVLVNIRRDQWRRLAIRCKYADAAVVDRETARGSDSESELIARTTVWRALDGLSPRRRAVVVMYELEGLTIESIASLLGITAITARWHLSKGRRDLARILNVLPETKT
jgi:RNA polymerase sigma-70 factor (ECF subfamily)